MKENFSPVYCTEKNNCDSRGVCDCIDIRNVKDFRGCGTYLDKTQDRIKLSRIRLAEEFNSLMGAAA